MDVDLLPVITTLLLGTAALSLTSACYAFRQNHYPVAIWCGWLMLAVALYCSGYAGELASHSVTEADFWIRLQFFGAAYLPAFIILLTLSYQRQSHPPLVVAALLMTLSSVTLVLVLGNDSHHLVYWMDGITRQNNLSLSQFRIGPAYYLHLVYLAISWVITNALLWRHYQRHAAYRTPILLIIAGVTAPWLGYLINIVNYSTLPLDLSPMCFAVTSICFWIGLFRYRFTNVAPIARDHLFEALNKPLLVLNEQLQIVDFNHKALELAPALGADMIGQDVSQLPCLPPGLHHLRYSQNEVELLEYRYDDRAWELAIYPLHLNQQTAQGYILVFQEVTARATLIETLRTQAERDTLTNLFNRRVVMEYLTLQMTSATAEQPLSVILFDIDHFKSINDQQGHIAGDMALCQIASLLQQTLMSTGIAGRYGGDEFLLVLPATSAEQAAHYAHELNRRSQQQLGISLSLGLSQTQGGEAAAELLQRADLALYQAKSRGRSRVESLLLACDA